MLISNYAIKFRIAVFVMVVVLVITGIMGYMGLPREGMPDITIPHVFVTATYEGTGPAEIEKLITIPLEKQLNNIEGVKQVKSVSAENLCSVDIEFVAGEDIDLAKQRVKDKVDLARPDLPADLDEPIVQAFNVSSDIPILIFALSGETDDSRLKNLAEELQDEIELLTGVRSADISGILEREIRVEIDLQRLMAYDLPLSLLISRIQQENSTVSAGNLEMGRNKYQVRIPGEFTRVAQIEKILVTEIDGNPVYLSDVAKVLDTHKDRVTLSRLNGERSVSVGVKKRSGQNSVALIGEVKKQIEDYPLPRGIHLTYVYDEADYVGMMIAELENNVASGFILVVAVLFVFLGGRNSIFVGLAIPLSMLTAFVAMTAMGFSLNMMVLFSLVLAVGMLVDNAIVIVENIYRNRTLGLTRHEAARRGASEVAWPVITSTITTCAAFSPLLFWPDIMGQFMGFMPKTLLVVLSASLFVAVVINPAICSAFIGGDKHGGARRGTGDHLFVRRYKQFLTGALEHRAAVALLAVLFFAVTLAAYSLWGKGVELFPETAPRNATIRVKFPQGTRLGRTDAALREIETIVATYDDVEFFLTTVGERGGGALAMGGSGTHVGNIHVEFVDYHDRQTDSMELVEALRRRIGAIPGAEVTVEREEEGPPTGAPVSLEVSGRDFDVLSVLAGRIKQAIETVPGLVDLEDDLEEALPELQFRVDRHRAALLGLDTDTIGLFLRTAIYGLEVSKFRSDEDEYDITLRLPEGQRNTAALLDRLSIPVPAGHSVPLSSMGEVVYAGGRGAINRTDRKRVITISGSNEGRGVDEVIAVIRRRLADIELPPGYEIKYTGDTEEMRESGAFLAKAFGVAIGLILVVLVIQFNSAVLPLIIIASVVLSIIGVMWGLMICGMRFGVIMTGVGVISLAGIVVNNAIVMVDCIGQRRKEGMGTREAVITAGELRLRPVLLTAATTILGLIPMAVGYSLEIHHWPPKLVTGSETSQWWAPMAVAVIFGLALATLLTLVLIPVLYSLTDSLVQRVLKVFQLEE